MKSSIKIRFIHLLVSVNLKKCQIKEDPFERVCNWLHVGNFLFYFGNGFHHRNYILLCSSTWYFLIEKIQMKCFVLYHHSFSLHCLTDNMRLEQTISVSLIKWQGCEQKIKWIAYNFLRSLIFLQVFGQHILR